MALALVLSGCLPRPVALSDGHSGSGGPTLSSELANTGALRARLAAPDDADVVLLYGGEHDGWMGVCGCEARQLGSLARVAGYRRAMRRRHDVPDLLLHAGGWADDAVGADGDLRDDAVVATYGMVRGLDMGGWDAVLVAEPDIPYTTAYDFPRHAVSATSPGAQEVLELDAGELTVAVTGASGPRAVDAIAGLAPALDADLVVVLAHHVGRQARDLARIEGVDVLIEAGEFSERYPPAWEGAAVWVRSDHETQRLGELRLVVEDGRVVAAKDRLIDLDDRIPSDRALRALHEDTARRIDEVQRELFAP